MQDEATHLEEIVKVKDEAPLLVDDTAMHAPAVADTFGIGRLGAFGVDAPLMAMTKESGRLMKHLSVGPPAEFFQIHRPTFVLLLDFLPNVAGQRMQDLRSLGGGQIRELLGVRPPVPHPVEYAPGPADGNTLVISMRKVR